MTVGDLIKNKDYDYISYRLLLPNDSKDSNGEFFGVASSKDGKLISLDGDTIYSEEDEIIRYEEWSNNEIKNGLTVVVKAEVM